MKTRGRLPTCLACAAALLGAGPALATPPIWHVRGPNGAEVTLFGSVHLLSDRTDWADPALDADLAHANRLLFEVPLDAAAQSDAQVQALRAGLLPPGQALSALLSPDERTLLARVCAKVGIRDPKRLDQLKPWLAEVTVSLLYFQSRGARPDLGVEKEIDGRTPAAVTRGAMETVGDQIAALSDSPLDDQVKSLVETLHEIEDKPDSFDKLAAAWQAGDVRTIRVEGLDDLKAHAPGAFQRLVVDRNRKWTPKIEALLKGSDHAVVVVGVGHLVGPDGVPAMLRHDGYKVEGP